MNKILLFLILYCFSAFLMAQSPKIDSLRQVYLQQKNDTQKVHTLNNLAFEYRENLPQKTLEFALKADSLSKALYFQKGSQDAKLHIGWAYYRLGNFPKALEYSFEGLKIAEKTEDKNAEAKAYNNIASVNYEQKNYDKALEYFTKAYEISQKLNDKKGMGRALNNLSFVNFEKGDYENALHFGQKALKNNEEIKDAYLTAFTLRTLGDIFAKKEKTENALKYYLDAIRKAKEVGHNTTIVTSLQRLALLYRKHQQMNNALRYYFLALEAAQKAGMKQNIRNAYQGIAEIYGEQKNFVEAYQYQKMFLAMNDSIFNEEKSKSLAQMQTIYETDKKQAEINLLTKDKIIKQKEITTKNLERNIFVIVSIFIAFLAYFFFVNHRKQKHTNYLLSLRNDEIMMQKEEINQQAEELKTVNEELKQTNDQLTETLHLANRQKSEIEKKNRDITDSITYAKRIQDAMLPDLTHIESVFPESFVLFKPRDIVSGDFYWFMEKKDENIDKVFIAALDCTGHGVPGAFMSMIGNDLLNHIVHDKEIYSPEMMLYEMHRGIHQTLHQHQNDNHDGIDLALCVIDRKEHTIEYAGAHNPLYYAQNGEFHQIKGSKMSIGGFQTIKSFDKHTIPLRANCLEISGHQPDGLLYEPEQEEPVSTTFYIFSDGFQDQFGSQHHKKFMTGRFRELIGSIHQRPMQEQKNILEATINNWMNEGDEKQVDDILVIGIRLNG